MAWRGVKWLAPGTCQRCCCSLSSLVIVLWSFSGGELAGCHPLGRASLWAPLSFDACGAWPLKSALGKNSAGNFQSKNSFEKTLIKFNNNNNKILVLIDTKNCWTKVYLYVQIGGLGRANTPLQGVLQWSSLTVRIDSQLSVSLIQKSRGLWVFLVSV